MKVLTVCHGGYVRSVALAYVLRNLLDVDAIPVGWSTAGSQTMQMLCEWADRIILVREHYRDHIPTMYREKITVYDVGRDRWLNCLHPELRDLFRDKVRNDPKWNACR